MIQDHLTKSNKESKDYQGRSSGGQFGAGTSGKQSDHKEQELLDRDAGKKQPDLLSGAGDHGEKPPPKPSGDSKMSMVHDKRDQASEKFASSSVGGQQAGAAKPTQNPGPENVKKCVLDKHASRILVGYGGLDDDQFQDDIDEGNHAPLHLAQLGRATATGAAEEMGSTTVSMNKEMADQLIDEIESEIDKLDDHKQTMATAAEMPKLRRTMRELKQSIDAIQKQFSTTETAAKVQDAPAKTKESHSQWRHPPSGKYKKFAAHLEGAAEVLQNRGFVVALDSALTTHSTYLTAKHPDGSAISIRISDHSVAGGAVPRGRTVHEISGTMFNEPNGPRHRATDIFANKIPDHAVVSAINNAVRDFDKSLCSNELLKANFGKKDYQSSDDRGRFGGGSRSGGDKQGSKPPEKTSPDVKAPSKQPSKAPGQSPKAKQSPEKPKMSMVHGKRDKIHSVLERHRLNPDKNKPNNIQVAHQHLENLQKTQDLKGLYKFQEHIGTMKPEEIRQFQKESGMRGKTAETLIKEANIAAQERSIWQQKCRKEGISVAHFKQAEDEIRSTHNAAVEEHNKMVDSLIGPNLKAKIVALNRGGKDYVTLEKDHGVKFDLLASAAAEQYPEYFGASGLDEHGANARLQAGMKQSYEDKLWDLAVAGKMQPMPKSETFKLAWDRIKTMQASGQYQKRKPRSSSKDGGWGDEVPF